MPFATLGKAVTLFYTDEGAGDQTLLFIHGYSCDSHDWSWQLPYFTGHFRVLAVDNRGHGRSSVPDTGYDHEHFAEDLANLLDHLRTGPVVAIGHSLGAVIASTLAIERPDFVRAVVTIDPGYLVAGDLAASFEGVVEALRVPDPVPVAQALMASLYTPSSPAALRTWHRRRIAGVPVHVLRETLTNALQGMALESTSAPYLTRRSCPVLAMHTDLDRASVEKGLFRDSRSRVVTFEGSGHWIHQERPGEVNHLIDVWFAGLIGS